MRRIHGGSGTGHGDVAEVELLRMQKSGQFPDEFVTPSTAPIFEVRLIFSLRKKVKKSFKVLSTGLQYLVCGCTMITFLFVPKVWKRALFILQKSEN